MKRALVTGATSFLGGALAARLGADGVAVDAVVRPTSETEALKALSPAPTLHVHAGGARSLAGIVAAAAPDVVFHLATCYRREHIPADIDALVGANLLFGTELLDAMARAGVKRLVNAGSYFQCALDYPSQALNLYAATKTAFEQIMAYYADAASLHAATLILFDVYGEGDPRDKLLHAIRDAQQSGTTVSLPAEDVWVDLVHVDDAAAAFVAAARALKAESAPRVPPPRYVVTGARHSLREIVTMAEEIGGHPVACQWGGFSLPNRHVVESSAGEPVPGWRAEISFEDGLRRFLAVR